ncbi:hypothetical protein B0T20DRAFT_348783 [Sordaria brevicollis]|uniref:Uncharacterized protein n=1 Tax=Sordaria brevicollis TaxID=83679 RepID=A0AAE0UF18_SORBR|nr:hypothetical protein B0T20DRAFT_348783 [Sordaria brevicollis]
MPSDTQDIQVFLAKQESLNRFGSEISDVVKEMKNSLIPQGNFQWEELLQAAPIATSCTGACYVAASSPESEVDLQRPSNGFKHLNFNSLRGNLVECGNRGRMAFITAERGMGVINLNTKQAVSKLNDSLQAVWDPNSARKLLRPFLDSAGQSTSRGLHEAMQQDKAFDQWLLYVCELYSVIVQQNGTAEEKKLSSEISQAAEQARLGDLKSSDAERKAMDLITKQSEASSEAFKKAAAEYPAGWNPLSQHVVGDLARAVTHTENALTQILVSATALKPKDAADHAYAEVLRIAHVLAILHVVVSGKNTDGNVDWEQAKTSIGYVTVMLNDSKTRLSRVGTESGPSKKLFTILDVSLQVASGIKEQTKDSDQVKKWQTDFAAQYQQAITLISTARTVSGTPAHGIPFIGSSDDQHLQLKAEDVQGQAFLELGKIRLTTAQQTLNAVKNNQAKSAELLTTQNGQLSQIQAELTKLTSSNISLAETKKILLSSLKTILILKQHLTTLTRFLKALETAIEITWKVHGEPFLETVTQLIRSDEDPHQNLKIGGQHSYTDLQRSGLFNALLTLLAHFGAVGSVTNTWTQLSREVVWPGSKMCDELSFAVEGGPEEAKRRAERLNRWATDSLETVQREAEKSRREVREGVEAKIREVDQMSARITPLPEVTRKAVEAGVDVTRQAVVAYLEEKGKNSPLTRFA